jgi:hypothetical protein
VRAARRGSCFARGVFRLVTARRLTLIAVAIALTACSQDTALQQHREKLESLGATTVAIADAWLGGAASGTYARAALEQARQLVEQERTSLAAKPEALADPRGADLSEAAERLSRLLALMVRDVEQGNASALRQRMAQIPIHPPQHP